MDDPLLYTLPAFFQTEIMSEGQFPLFLFHNVVSDTEIDYMVKTASKQVRKQILSNILSP